MKIPQIKSNQIQIQICRLPADGIERQSYCMDHQNMDRRSICGRLDAFLLKCYDGFHYSMWLMQQLIEIKFGVMKWFWMIPGQYGYRAISIGN